MLYMVYTKKKTYVEQNSAPNMLKPMGLLKTFDTIQHYVRYHDNVNKSKGGII